MVHVVGMYYAYWKNWFAQRPMAIKTVTYTSWFGQKNFDSPRFPLFCLIDHTCRVVVWSMWPIPLNVTNETYNKPCGFHINHMWLHPKSHPDYPEGDLKFFTCSCTAAAVCDWILVHFVYTMTLILNFQCQIFDWLFLRIIDSMLGLKCDQQFYLIPQNNIWSIEH